MRLRGILLLVVLGVACSGAAQGAAVKDQGSDRPPARLTTDGKNIWMTEWTACWRVSLAHISKVLHVPVKPGMSPQQAARRIAQRAVYLLYETQPETAAAADGCRNGILWRYYHPS